MTAQYLYILDSNELVLSTGLPVPEIPDPQDSEVMIADAAWIADRTTDLVNVGISEQVIIDLFSDYSIPKYVFDPVAAISANITERNYNSVIKVSQKWKDRKKLELTGMLRRDFGVNEENKYQTLKAMKADGATLPQDELDFLTAFESWRTTRLAQYEADKTANGIT